uniref:Uncharacterized protein n=1 Tax=Triticum urartu TaxID=4572 RepID=A0A8R7P4R1_TRIUA
FPSRRRLCHLPPPWPPSFLSAYASRGGSGEPSAAAPFHAGRSGGSALQCLAHHVGFRLFRPSMPCKNPFSSAQVSPDLSELQSTLSITRPSPGASRIEFKAF